MAEVGAEYRRQINDEGYDPDHDDTHREGELACAAVAYAMPEWLNEWMDKNDIKIWPYEGHPKFKDRRRSEEHTSELQSLMRISYAVFCLKKKKSQSDPVQKTIAKT